VDQKNAEGTFRKFPQAKRYKDFRVMFEQQKDIDAVTISTPDHTHFLPPPWHSRIASMCISKSP